MSEYLKQKRLLTNEERATLGRPRHSSKTAIEAYEARLPSQKQLKQITKQAVRGIAVSEKMLASAQGSYKMDPEYGLTDADMKRAIKAALMAYGKD